MGLFSSIGKVFSSVADIGKSVGSFIDPFAPLISGGLSYLGQSSANQANAAQAGYNRDFQAYMSNTQYQRAVKDMTAAGLNPMLAYQQGGAGNVSGAVAAPMQNALGQGASSALQSRTMLAQAKNLDEQNQLIRDDAFLKRQQALTEVNRSFRESQAANIDRERMDLEKMLGLSTLKLQLAQSRNYDANSAYTALRNYQDSLNTNALRYDKEARDSFVGETSRKSGTIFGDLGSIFKFGRK